MYRIFLIILIYLISSLSVFGFSGISADSDSIADKLHPGKYLAHEVSPKAIPPSPINLTIVEADFDYIYIVWEDVSDDETGFIIERHSEEDEYQNYDTVSANTTYYLDYRVEPYTYYYYRVKAINEDGESATSNEAIGQTNSLPHSPPRGPSDIRGEFNGNSHITVTWDDKSDNEDAFYIYKGESSSSIVFLDSVDANTTVFVDYAVEQQHTYYYYVTASNSYGISVPTDTLILEVEEISELEKPYLSILKTNSSSISLIWDSVSGNTIQYQLFRISENNDTLKLDPVSGTGFVDPDLNANTTYFYQILVTDAFSNKALSNVVKATTLPSFVANRTTDSLIAMFILSQRDKALVPDYSWYGDPVELTISDTLSLGITTNEALKISYPNALISQPEYNSKISEACKNTNEISIECWLKTSNTVCSEMTSVLTFGNERSTAFSLNCQPAADDLDKIVYSVNLATKTTNEGGYPTFLSNVSLYPNVLNHIVFSHDESGVEKFYINGQLVAESYRPSGFENWLETYTLVLANDLGQQKPWLGELYMCSLYNTALEPDDILSNYSASPFTQENFILNSTAYQMVLSPNPANDYVSIVITDPHEYAEITERYFIRIVNQYGQVMNETIVSDFMTGETIELEIDYLPPGIYTVNLYNQHALINTQKLLITR